MSYWLPNPGGSTGRAQSTYWADDDPRYIARQQELGRDTSELRPEIRAEYEARLHAARAQASTTSAGRLKVALTRSSGGDDLFGARFTGQRYPWWRRLVLRMRGWE